MGGIETDIDGKTRVDGIWAAGEAACVSLHGANRLGSNSTAECLVWGGIAGEEIVKALPGLPAAAPRLRTRRSRRRPPTSRSCSRRAGRARTSTTCAGSSAPSWTRNVGVFRTGERPRRSALATMRELRVRSSQAPVVDKGRVYNSNLFHALELENLLDLAEVTRARRP